MNRIETVFKNLNRSALITFITAGDTDYKTSLNVMKALPAAGADIIELGMPFTDPVADGPTIQAAGLRALAGGASMKRTLQMVREFREDNSETPIVLMGYYNPVMAYGVEKFVTDAATAGIDGLIIVDLPPEESGELQNLLKNTAIDLIRLVTPTTKGERLQKVLQGAGGFLYYVSITGITGAAKADLSTIKPHIAEIRAQTDLPIAIGFGIKTPDDVRAFAALADGVVVGSAIVNTIANDIKNADPAPVAAQVKALAGGL